MIALDPFVRSAAAMTTAADHATATARPQRVYFHPFAAFAGLFTICEMHEGAPADAIHYATVYPALRCGLCGAKFTGRHGATEQAIHLADCRRGATVLGGRP